MQFDATPMTDQDWEDFSGLVRDSVIVRHSDPVHRLATAALADPDRCGRVLLALIKERGIGRYNPMAQTTGLPRTPVPSGDFPTREGG